MKIKRRDDSLERYVLSTDQELPKEEQTVFLLRGLTALDRAAVQDEMMAANYGGIGGAILFLQRSLVGVEGLTDEDGEPVEFDSVDGHATLEFLDKFESEVLNELAYRVAQKGGLLASEKKG